MTDSNAFPSDGRRAPGDAQPGGPQEVPRDPGVDDDPQVRALRADIERTREQLADTVDQLQAKLDVKARASAGVHDAAARASATVHDAATRAKEHVVDPEGHPRPAALGAGGAIVAGLLAVALVALWRQRRAKRRTWERWR